MPPATRTQRYVKMLSERFETLAAEVEPFVIPRWRSRTLPGPSVRFHGTALAHGPRHVRIRGLPRA